MKTRIIYIEDDNSLARLVQRHLERLGYEVDLAIDGEEGVAMIMAGNYQVALIDYQLPKLDGPSVIRTLIAENCLPPTIMVSAIGDMKVVLEAMHLGAFDYVIKEPEPDRCYLDQLPVAISRIVAQQKQQDEAAKGEIALQEAKGLAEKANTAKSKFLAAVSHDLRQPLCAALLLNSVLSRKIKKTSHKKIIEEQATSLKTMEVMIRTLLELSKLEAGVITPQLSNFPVKNLIKKIEAEFKAQAREKKLDLHIVQTSVEICSDPLLLERILQNFMSNAIKYTEKGKILLGSRRHGNNLRIEVWDTGIGIPKEKCSQIFEAYYQLDNHAREVHKGLGLGLSIVDQLACLLDYPLDIHSTPGLGTLFAVEVPLAVNNESETEFQGE